MLIEVIGVALLGGIFIEGWAAKVLFIPALLGTYAMARFSFSYSARVIHDIEDGNTWRWLYAPIFLYHFILAAAAAALGGVISDLLL